MDEPGIPAVLSLFIPGLGQIYNGDYARGIFWLLVAAPVWVVTGGLFGRACHLIAAFTAYRRAENRSVRTA